MTTRDLERRFEALVEEHRKILYKISNSYCRNPADREDLAQEIVLQLWRSFGRFDDSYRFSTWMYRIALNVAISFYRRESARARRVLSGDEHLLLVVDDAAAEPEEMRLVYQFIERVDPLSRALLLLYLDGNSHREIGEVLGISTSNVGTKIGRLKQAMRQEFAGTQPN